MKGQLCGAGVLILGLTGRLAICHGAFCLSRSVLKRDRFEEGLS